SIPPALPRGSTALRALNFTVVRLADLHLATGVPTRFPARNCVEAHWSCLVSGRRVSRQRAKTWPPLAGRMSLPLPGFITRMLGFANKVEAHFVAERRTPARHLFTGRRAGGRRSAGHFPRCWQS